MQLIIAFGKLRHVFHGKSCKFAVKNTSTGPWKVCMYFCVYVYTDTPDVQHGHTQLKCLLRPCKSSSVFVLHVLTNNLIGCHFHIKILPMYILTMLISQTLSFEKWNAIFLVSSSGTQLGQCIQFQFIKKMVMLIACIQIYPLWPGLYLGPVNCNNLVSNLIWTLFQTAIILCVCDSVSFLVLCLFHHVSALCLTTLAMRGYVMLSFLLSLISSQPSESMTD